MLPEPLNAAAMLPWEASHIVEPADPKCPEISIVLPIYNAGKFLERTLRSLLCNDLSGVEIIVMDGGSTDDTPAILERYRDYFKVCVSAPDNGQSDAINRGFQQATKPILYWLNGDDLLLPDVLTPVRKRFVEPDRPQVVVGDAYMTELDLKPINHFQFSDEKLKFSYLIDYAANHLVQPSVFFTRQAWDRCGPVAEDLHYAMDADLFLAMSSKYEFVHLPKDIAYSVYHEDCKTRDKRAESITELALVQARHGGFNYAEKTLHILVEMFNESAKGAEAEDSANRPNSDNCPKCQINHQKVKVMEERMKRKMKMLLDKDLQLS